ncbi:MAG: hypothetical protein GX363_04035 [Clostridiales bacterium]|jgi:hypothetical protein|nr:hypothetical protein [Clostridiales bacterium]
MTDDREITFDLKEHIGIFGKDSRGWTRELNKVSWNGGPVKYDIRNWDEEHKRMSKGITLTEDELIALRDLIQEIDLS